MMHPRLAIGAGILSAKSVDAIIAGIFAGADTGLIFDPQNALARYQENNALTLASAAGNVIGLLQDVKHGLSLGPELLSGSWANSGTIPFDVFALDGAGFSATKNVAGSGQQAYQGSFPVQSGKAYYISAAVPANTFATNQVHLALAVTTTQRSTTTIGLLYSGGYTSRPFSGILFSNFTGNVSLRLGTLSSATGSITVGASSVKQLLGSHAAQSSLSLKPKYQTGPQRIEADLVDDALVVTFPAALGTNCTVVYGVPGVGATVLTGQNIGTTYSITWTFTWMLISNRPLTAAELAACIKRANQRSF